MKTVNAVKSFETGSSDIYESRIFSVLPEGIHPGGLTLTDHLVESCGFNPGDLILDLGCGTGASLDFIRGKKIFNTAGVDLSALLLKKGQENFRDLHLVQGNGMNLPFAESIFNGVIAECTLSIMDDLRRVLSEIKRVLVPGGKLAVSDIYIPQPDHADCADELLRGACIAGAFIRDEIARVLNDSGFRIILWEDHSKLWREFIAGLILNGISVSEMLKCSSASEKHNNEMMPALLKVKRGYFCMIAEKI